jgi:hypothetical protein
MRKVLFFLSLFLIFPVLSVETEGRLSFPSVKNLIVGEVFTGKLVLLPFEERLISKSSFEGKNFLGLFYVANVRNIKTSENNYDAVIVEMDLVLPSKFESQELYIWQLGDRNIPIKIETRPINNVTLNAKDFVIYSPPPVSFDEFDWNYLGLLLITVFLLGYLFYTLQKRRLKRRAGSLMDYRSLMSSVSNHKDLENIYKIRREILVCVQDLESKQKFNEFFEKYKWDQFRPEWREREIEPLVEEAKELSGEISNGV